MTPTPKQRAVTLKRNGFDDGVVGAILGINAVDVQSLVADVDSAVVLPIVERRTLTHTELLALGAGADGVEIVADPGPGKGVFPLWAYLLFIPQVGYTLDGEGTLTLDNDVALLADSNADLLTQSSYYTAAMALQQRVDTGNEVLAAAQTQDPPLGALNLEMRGNITASDGDPANTLTVIVGYVIADAD